VTSPTSDRDLELLELAREEIRTSRFGRGLEHLAARLEEYITAGGNLEGVLWPGRGPGAHSLSLTLRTRQRDVLLRRIFDVAAGEGLGGAALASALEHAADQWVAPGAAPPPPAQILLPLKALLFSLLDLTHRYQLKVPRTRQALDRHRVRLAGETQQTPGDVPCVRMRRVK
jgi:hypothetical protein